MTPRQLFGVIGLGVFLYLLVKHPEVLYFLGFIGGVLLFIVFILLIPFCVVENEWPWNW